MRWFVSVPSFSISTATVSFAETGPGVLHALARTMLVRPPQPVPQ
jgi:hypothetical protein